MQGHRAKQRQRTGWNLDRAQFFTLGLGSDECQHYYIRATILLAIKQLIITTAVTIRLTMQEIRVLKKNQNAPRLSDNYHVNLTTVVVVVFFTLTDRASTIPNNTRGCQSGTWSAGQKKIRGTSTKLQ